LPAPAEILFERLCCNPFNIYALCRIHKNNACWLSLRKQAPISFYYLVYKPTNKQFM
jgi:hypothetical protein